MIIGIECTAHTFGVGVVRKGKILANVKDMYRPLKGGIVPVDAARHHREVANFIFNEALEKAGASDSDIEAIAVSNAPGLAPCLIAGLEFAKIKSNELKVPLVPVNHCIAHLEIGQLAKQSSAIPSTSNLKEVAGQEGARNPVLLYASGANTQIIAYASGKYRVFGETLDMGIGNFIDSFARELGVAFPGGPEVEKLAKQSRNYIELPYSVKGMDVSFSGMYTKLKQLYSKGMRKEDLCFSLQECAFAMLVEASERALAHIGKRELVLGGGVACNSRLQEMCRIMCEERGAKCFIPAREFLVDNAGMIAFTGELMFRKGIKFRPSDVDIKPRERTDDVKVSWR